MSTTVAEYEYNVLGWRTVKRLDTAASTPDGLDQERRYDYLRSWQLAEEHIDEIDSADQTAWTSIYFDVTNSTNERLSALRDLDALDADNQIGYAGYCFDAELACYGVRHRVYDPSMGRWITRDPVGYVDGLSSYGYAKSNSVRLADPLGLACEQPGGDRPGIIEDPGSDAACEGAVLNIYERCGGTDLFERALGLVQQSCNQMPTLQVSCFAPDGLPPPTGASYTCIRDNKNVHRLVISPATPCAGIAHELLHVADFCSAASNGRECGDGTISPGKQGTQAQCDFHACTEARANALSCCAYLELGYGSWGECMTSNKQEYLKDADRSSCNTDSWRLKWDMCASQAGGDAICGSEFEVPVY
ncbi:MAG: RHS repeat-associated core domain-containing protein [Planctomycetota bacterium]